MTSELKDDLIAVYHDCDDIDKLRQVLLDCRNEIIRLRLLNEKLRKV